jgi:hypothetical protein
MLKHVVPSYRCQITLCRDRRNILNNIIYYNFIHNFDDGQF